MNGTYHPALVVLSVLIATFASYVALDLANSITVAKGRTRLAWLAGGSLAMGSGIWSMHFIGMLAFRMPGMAIAYDVSLLFLSVLIAVAASALALFVVSRPAVTVPTHAGAAMAMGAAIAGMHYTGMWSMRTGSSIRWSRPLVAASIVIAVVASFVALWIAVRFRMDRSERGHRLRMIGSGVMGLAIAGMHYTGMAAARFSPGGGALPIGAEDVLATGGLAVAVTGTTILILAIAVAGSIVTREMARHAALGREIERLYAEARESAEQYRLLFDANPQPMLVYEPESLAFLAVNDTAVGEYGYSRDKFLTMSVWDLHLPEDREALAKDAERLSGNDRVSAWRHVRKDGSLVDVTVDARSITYEGKAARIALVQDVTQRKRAEAALRQSEEHFRALIERTSDIVTILEPDGTIRYESPSVERVLGYGPEELVGRNVFEYVHPEHQTRIQMELRALLERNAQVVVQVPFRHADGSWRMLEATGANLLSNPAVRGIVVDSRDVTERMEAEGRERELIREQSARVAAEAGRHELEEILESITDAFYAFDHDWRMTYVNARAEALMGQSRSEVLGRTAWELFPFLKKHPVFSELHRVIQERIAVDLDYPSLIPGKWLRLHASPTRDGAAVYVRDITRRKDAEERSRFQAHLLDTVGQAVVATGPDGAVRYWNHAAEQLYGWTAAEVLGRNVVDVTPSQISRAQGEAILRELRAGRPWSGEFTVRRRDGTEFPAWVSDTPVMGADGSLEAIIGVSFDITERKAAEDALRDERERLAEAQRVARLGSWEWDIATGAVRWSDEHFRIWGYEPQAFAPTLHSAMAAVHPEDLSRMKAETEIVLRSKTPFEYDFRIVRPDGEVRFMQSRGLVITDAGGAPVRVIGTDQDVSERKRQEEKLDRMKAALDATMDGICIVSQEGVFEYVNQAKAHIFGYAGPEELVGRQWRTVYPAAEVERIEEEILPVFELSGRWRGELTAQRKDGSTFPAAASMTRIDAERWVAVDWDITEHRRAQDELLRRGEMVRLLQMAATAANESATLEQALHMVVEQVCEFTHLDAGHAYVADAGTGELTPTNIWCTADPERFAAFQRVTRDTRFGVGDGLPGRALAAGEPVWVEDIATESRLPRRGAAEAADLHAGLAFPVMAGSDVVAVLEFFSTQRLRPDRLLQQTLGNVGTQLGRVAERTRADAALRAAREEAERANQAKSEFLSRMSHELRTPLNAILGFGQLLEADVEREEDRESVELILRAGRHLLALIDEVLDLSRIDAGEMSLSVEPVSVGDAVGQSLELVRHMAADRGIALTSIPESAAERRVQADLQRLKQVILNLVSNAIKYNRPGGSVALSCEERENGRLRIVVSDTGQGIPEEKLQRLFVPFERLDAKRSAVEGTGLGLALSRGLMEAMGGALGVESRTGVGSRFWAELPRASDAQAEPAPQPEGVGPAAERGTEPTHTVLVIEDNLANVRLMERIFRRRPQVRLLVAMQGSIGLELAREHRPALILLDLNLPGISGREVLRELRNDPALRHVPVVMVSGDAMPEKVERLKEEGAHGYITKPFSVNEVLRLVDETLDAGPAAPPS